MNEGLWGGGIGASNDVSVMIKETYFKPLCIGKKYCLIVSRQGGIINFAKAPFNKRRGTNFLLVLTFQAQPWAIALSWLGPQTQEEPKTVPYLIHKVSRPGCWGPYILLCKVPARVSSISDKFWRRRRRRRGQSFEPSKIFHNLFTHPTCHVRTGTSKSQKIFIFFSYTICTFRVYNLPTAPPPPPPQSKNSSPFFFKSFFPQINPKKNLLLLAQFLRAWTWLTYFDASSLSLFLSLSLPQFSTTLNWLGFW